MHIIHTEIMNSNIYFIRIQNRQCEFFLNKQNLYLLKRDHFWISQSECLGDQYDVEVVGNMVGRNANPG